METTYKNEKEQMADFIRLCFRNWYYFIISGIVCLLIALIYIKIATPVYEVDALVALRHDESLTGSIGKQSPVGLFNMMGMGRGSENIEDETLKLSSHGNFKQIVKAMDLNKSYSLLKCLGLWKQPLYNHPPVLLNVDPIVADTMQGIFTFNLSMDEAGHGKLKVKYQGKRLGRFTIDAFPATISTPVTNFTLSLSPEYAAYKKPLDLEIVYTNYDFITQIYTKLIDIDFYKKSSDLILLKIKYPNTDIAKKLILEAIDRYNKNWDMDKTYRYENTMRYMNQRLEENMKDLSNIDQKIQQFKNQYALTDIETDVKYYYIQGAETQKEILAISTQIHLMEIIYTYIRDEANRYNLIPFVLSTDNQAINLFIEKYNELMVQRNNSRKNQSQSPLFTELDEQLNSQRKNLVETLNKEIEGRQAALTTIKRQDAEVTRKLGNVPFVEREYISLKREQELQQAIYTFLLEKREELGILSVSLMSKLKIINEPYVVNKLVSPSLMKILATAFFFGVIVIPIALMYGIPYVRMLRKKEE